MPSQYTRHLKMRDMKVILLVGLPGSGKSSWLAERDEVAISSDEVRRLLTGDVASQRVNDRVFATVRYLLEQRLAIGMETSYIDATNLTPTERRPYIEIAQSQGAAAEAVFFDVPLPECKRRNAARARVVPEEAMDKLAQRLTPPVLEEGFSSITVIGSGPA